MHLSLFNPLIVVLQLLLCQDDAKVLCQGIHAILLLLKHNRLFCSGRVPDLEFVTHEQQHLAIQRSLDAPERLKEDG